MIIQFVINQSFFRLREIKKNHVLDISLKRGADRAPHRIDAFSGKPYGRQISDIIHLVGVVSCVTAYRQRPSRYREYRRGCSDDQFIKGVTDAVDILSFGQCNSSILAFSRTS